jgi:hypothetical protein
LLSDLVDFFEERYDGCHAEELQMPGGTSQSCSASQLAREACSDSESEFSCVSYSASTAASSSAGAGNTLPNVQNKFADVPFMTPWEFAMLRAELAAQQYAFALQEYTQTARKTLAQRNRDRPQVQSYPRRESKRSFEEELLHVCNARISWRATLGPTNPELSDFDEFQKSFLEEHGMQVCKHLHGHLHYPIELKPTPLHSDVQKAFWDTCHGQLNGKVVPAFHGTAEKNLDSIYRSGLLIPGRGNNLQVAHGSAHGLGIYTAAVSSPGLAYGFCRHESPMLVCGVLDDTVAQRQSEFIRSLPITGQSNNIRRVGGAIVIFEPIRVAPLFTVSRYVPQRILDLRKKWPLHNNSPKHVGPKTRLPRARPSRYMTWLQWRIIQSELKQQHKYDYFSRRAARKRRT